MRKTRVTRNSDERCGATLLFVSGFCSTKSSTSGYTFGYICGEEMLLPFTFVLLVNRGIITPGATYSILTQALPFKRDLSAIINCPINLHVPTELQSDSCWGACPYKKGRAKPISSSTFH